MAVRFTGLNELRVALKKKTDLTAVRKVVQHDGAKLQKAVQREADFSKGYQTGTTKRSVGLEISDAGLTATVAPTTEYSPYLEYGTRFMEAQPFVSPGFNEVKDEFKRHMDRLVK